MAFIELKSPGNFLTSQAERWSMGIWTATSRSLAFSNKNLMIWSRDYSSFKNLNLEKLPFAFGKKESIRIELEKKGESVWLIVENLKKWQKFIHAHTFHQPFLISEEQVYELAQEIDVISEEILWYLWRNKHATLTELSQQRTVIAQSEVLRRIKSVINPLAEELFGFPFCIFMSEKNLPGLNKVITNSWCLYHMDF